MKSGFLFFFLGAVAVLGQEPISAALTLVQYEPFIFNLQFSEAVAQPAFQLLLNNLYPLNYTVLPAAQPATSYFFQVSPFQYPAGESLENYEIIFNNPMKVGGGRLGAGYFMVTASKVTVEIGFSQVLGLLAVIAAYTMINFTILGLALIEFLQVYCLLMFRDEMKTMLYHEISRDLLLLNPKLTDGTYLSTSTIAAILLSPIIVVLAAGLIGFLVKRWVRKTDSIAQKIIYETFVYNLFVTASTAFLFPLFYNSLQFYQLTKTGTIDPASSLAKWGSFVSYLSIVITFAILYLFLYAINPKLNQSQASWKKYLKTPQFQSFRKLHEVLWWDPWYKRNKHILIIAKRLLIGGLFFWVEGFEVAVFLLEFINIFYIFTTHPFKQEIYMNSAVITRLLMFLFYGLILVGNLYYSLGTITINYQSVKSYLYARDTIFLIIILSIFLFIFYEIYNKCSNLNYQIRLVKEQNEYRLKITEKQNMENEEITHRKNIKSFGESEDHSYNRNTRLTTYDYSKNSESTPTPKKKEGSLEKQGSMKRKSMKRHDETMKSSLPVQLEAEGDRERAESYVTSEGKTSKERKNRHKWKKESLLAEILKEN